MEENNDLDTNIEQEAQKPTPIKKGPLNPMAKPSSIVLCYILTLDNIKPGGLRNPITKIGLFSAKDESVQVKAEEPPKLEPNPEEKPKESKIISTPMVSQNKKVNL